MSIDLKIVKAVFDKKSSAYRLNSKSGIWNLIRNMEALSLRELIKDKDFSEVKVLEVGPGAGFYTDMLKSKFKTYHCIELSSGMINDLELDGIDVFEGDFFKFSKQKYDVLLFLGSFEFLGNTKDVLEKSKNLLSENGEIILFIPNLSIISLIYKAYHFFLNKISILTLSKRKVLQILNGSGFRVHKYAKAGPVNHLLWLKKL